MVPIEEDLDLGLVKHRSVSGLVVLISRSLVLQLIALGGFFFLSTFLSIADIGLFFAVGEIVAILGYFSDIGLAAALIQKKDTLSLTAIRTTFTIQQLLVIGLSLIVVSLTTPIAEFFHLSQPGIWLLWSLIIGFFLASLKTIPSVLLERQLQFKKLVWVETVETLIFYLLAIMLAWQGYGVTSYALAVVARGLVGVALIYILAPWPIGIAFSLATIRELLNFGLPYQANTLIAVVKDRLLNLILFKLIGASGMGIIGWAQTWSQKPLRFISDNVTKVTFPAFARLQSHPQELDKAVNKMLFFSSVLIFPLLVGAGVMAGPIVELIPNYQKWQPALPVFYLYLFNSGWAAISTPVTNTLAALGQITLVTKLMVMWTVLTWLIIAPLAYLYGYTGVAVGVAVVALSSIVPIWLLYQYVKFDLFTQVGRPLSASLLMGGLVWSVLNFWPSSLINSEIVKLVVAVSVGTISYGTLVHWLTGRQLIPQVKLFLKTMKQG